MRRGQGGGRRGGGRRGGGRGSGASALAALAPPLAPPSASADPSTARAVRLLQRRREGTRQSIRRRTERHGAQRPPDQSPPGATTDGRQEKLDPAPPHSPSFAAAPRPRPPRRSCLPPSPSPAAPRSPAASSPPAHKPARCAACRALRRGCLRRLRPAPRTHAPPCARDRALLEVNGQTARRPPREERGRRGARAPRSAGGAGKRARRLGSDARGRSALGVRGARNDAKRRASSERRAREMRPGRGGPRRFPPAAPRSRAARRAGSRVAARVVSAPRRGEGPYVHPPHVRRRVAPPSSDRAPGTQPSALRSGGRPARRPASLDVAAPQLRGKQSTSSKRAARPSRGAGDCLI